MASVKFEQPSAVRPAETPGGERAKQPEIADLPVFIEEEDKAIFEQTVNVDLRQVGPYASSCWCRNSRLPR